MTKRPHQPHPSHRLSTQDSGLSTRNSPRPTHWANVSDWYDQLVGDQGSEYHQHVILPGILRMLQSAAPNKIENQKPEIKKTLHILELACGQGVLARKLATPGEGHRVTALDAAAPLIVAAQQRNKTDRLPIAYHVADATKLLDAEGNLLPPLVPGAFDAAAIILAIQNMTPLSPIWHAVRVALKPHGSLLLVMMHPCFRIPQHSDWHWDEKLSRQGRVVFDYLGSTKIDIQTHPGQAAHGKASPATTHFHRPLQAYLNTLGNAGLLIDHIEEWPSHKSSQPGPKQKALDHSRKEIPLFLALRARKCP